MPGEKELDGYVYVCSEVMATEQSFSKINYFSILQNQNTHTKTKGEKKKRRWKWCKGTSFYLNQMSPFVPKQRSYPGEFAPKSTYSIRTECNSCLTAITVRSWCPGRALTVTGKPKLGSCAAMMLKYALWSMVWSSWLFGILAQLSSGYSFQKGCHLFEVLPEWCLVSKFRHLGMNCWC